MISAAIDLSLNLQGIPLISSISSEGGIAIELIKFILAAILTSGKKKSYFTNSSR